MMLAQPIALTGGHVRRIAVPVALVGLVAAGASTTATAAPSSAGVTHRNNPVCAAPTVGTAACLALRHDTYVNGQPAPNGTGGPSGYGPADLHSAYALAAAAASNGGGQTVAIVDAYD